MEIARAFGLAIIVLFAILAAALAVVIVVNLIIGGTLYITGKADYDQMILVDTLAVTILALLWRKWRKSATNPTNVSQTDQPVG